MQWSIVGLNVECQVVKAGNLGSVQFYKWIATFKGLLMSGRIESQQKFVSAEKAWDHAGVCLKCLALLEVNRGINEDTNTTTDSAPKPKPIGVH